MVALLLPAICLVLVLAVGPPGAAQAMPPDGCATGLPADMAAQLQPLLRALSDATGDIPKCASAQPDASGQAQPSQHRRDLQLIAETLALLAMADPGYGYSGPGYGYTQPAAASAAEAGVPPGDSPVGAACAPMPDSPSAD